jgi:hypothetical protein
MANDTATREMLARVLSWEDAHVGFETAIDGLPAGLRGVRPEGAPYSAWELVEHLRIAQRDILDFCRGSDYKELEWPKDYWPAAPTPPSDDAWDQSVAQFLSDRQALADLAKDSSRDLHARIPHGTGQTILRELLLVADHAAYHIGEIVLVRRLLGAWK